MNSTRPVCAPPSRTAGLPARGAALALALVLLPAVPLPGQGRYTDQKYGYSIDQIKDWQAIPPQPTDEYIVAKWVSPRDIRNLPAEMHVYVFDRKAGAGAPATEAPEGLPEGLAAYFQARKPKDSYESWAKTDFERRAMALGEGKPFRVKAPKDANAEGWIYRTARESGYRLGGREMEGFSVSVAIVRTDRIEYAVEIFYNEKEERKLRLPFETLLRGFQIETVEPPWLAELAAKAADAEAPKDDGYARTDKTQTPLERARERAREQAARTPGWWYHETPRYIIVTNVERKGNNEEFIRLLGRRLESIRDRFEIDFPPKKPIEAVSIVRVCKDDKTYRDYGGPGGSAGYWFAPAEELVFYKDAGDKRTPFAVLSHEAFHQYIYYCCGNISPHSWYNEGYGDYYSGTRMTDDGRRVIRIDPFAWRRDTIKTAVRNKTYVPIKEIIHYTQAQYYSKADLCYAQGWSIVYFLNQGIPENHPWRSILPKYLETIQESGSEKEAVNAAFEGVDLDEFEKAWAEFTIR